MKTNEFEIVVEDKPASATVDRLRHSLSEFNRAHAGHDHHKDLIIVLRNAHNKMVGGLVGGTYYGYLHVDVLWVDEAERRAGHGGRLLEAAEQEAVKRGCTYAHLDTHGFQALGFYQKRGYTVVGELKDLPPGDCRYLLRKVLKQ